MWSSASEFALVAQVPAATTAAVPTVTATSVDRASRRAEIVMPPVAIARPTAAAADGPAARARPPPAAAAMYQGAARKPLADQLTIATPAARITSNPAVATASRGPSTQIPSIGSAAAVKPVRTSGDASVATSGATSVPAATASATGSPVASQRSALVMPMAASTSGPSPRTRSSRLASRMTRTVPPTAEATASTRYAVAWVL